MGTQAADGAEARAFLSLGSNLGDRRENLKRALRLLGETPGLRIVRVSGMYRTAPLSDIEQPDFLNLAAEARTTLAPLDLLHATKAIERDVGRTPGPRWGPRLIDIDILLYDDVRVEMPELTLPHPRIQERAFVMAPLAEIAPDLKLSDGRRAIEVAAALAEEQEISADL